MNAPTIITRLIPRDIRYGGTSMLDADAEGTLKRKLHDRVQSFAKREIKPEEYHLRSVWLCNDARDFYYSSFKRAALPEVAELVIGAPTIRSHNHGGAAVGLCVDAEVTRNGPAWPPGATWVKATEMIPSDAIGDVQVSRMDMGVENEVSIGWRCMGSDCRVCGDPVWACAHIPGEVYKRHGIASYEFSGLTNVLEYSHVVRGGQKGTGVAPEDGARSAFVDDTRDIAWDRIASVKRVNQRIGSPTLASFLSTAEAMRAVGMGELFGMPGERANVQSIEVSRKRFDDVALAKRWLRENDFRVDRMNGTHEGLVFEQFAAADAKDLWEQKLEEGIVARIGTRASKDQRGRSDGRSLNDWLAAANN